MKKKGSLVAVEEENDDDAAGQLLKKEMNPTNIDHKDIITKNMTWNDETSATNIQNDNVATTNLRKNDSTSGAPDTLHAMTMTTASTTSMLPTTTSITTSARDDISVRILYGVPPKRSRRRGIQNGCLYLVLTAPPALLLQPPPPNNLHQDTKNKINIHHTINDTGVAQHEDTSSSEARLLPPIATDLTTIWKFGLFPNLAMNRRLDDEMFLQQVQPQRWDHVFVRLLWCLWVSNQFGPPRNCLVQDPSALRYSTLLLLLLLLLLQLVGSI